MVKLIIKLSLLLFLAPVATIYGQIIHQKNGLVQAKYVSLDGVVLSKGNPIGAGGNIHQFIRPILRLLRTQSSFPKGTVLLLPGGAYEILKMKNEGQKIAKFLNKENFDVALLEYHINSGLPTRDLALEDVRKALRLLKTNRVALGLRSGRLDIMGFGAGGHLAARAIQRLSVKEQPANLVLVCPSYLDETLKGTVFPAVMPPINPMAKLLVTFSAYDNKEWIHSCSEYAKTWKGYDGQETFQLLPDSAYISGSDIDPLNEKFKLPGLLKDFLISVSGYKAPGPNPATIPVQGYNKKRHAAKLVEVSQRKFDLVLLGNSITNNFEKPEYQPVWNQFFAPRKTLNLGFSAYRTENIIWNIEHGELDGQSPKVLVLEIGTNNVDEKNYPTRHTAGQLAGGIKTIVDIVRQKLPNTKIIILRCFPGCYDGPNPTSHRAILERASDIVVKMADGKHIFYCDVNHVFLNLDGSINHELMPDWLHPSPAGAKLWAQAMEPLLSGLMGDISLDQAL